MKPQMDEITEASLEAGYDVLILHQNANAPMMRKIGAGRSGAPERGLSRQADLADFSGSFTGRDCMTQSGCWCAGKDGQPL